MTSTTIDSRVAAEIERVGKFVSQADDANAVPRETGEFLHSLILAGLCTRGLEIGTSYGYSGLWIASALANNGGELVTIDRSKKKTSYARDVFSRAGLAQRVTLRNGDALDVLAGLDGRFDFVFVDAHKPSSLKYFELFRPLLEQRAVIVTDNITSHAEQLSGYVQHLRGLPGLRSIPVLIGSGLELTVRYG